MASPDEVTLWKAPCPGGESVKEIEQGFDPVDYPGLGPFFASDQVIALGFKRHYQGGMQVVHMPRAVFEQLVEGQVLEPDPLYPVGAAWYVPVDGLAIFNQAIQQGSPNEYYPE